MPRERRRGGPRQQRRSTGGGPPSRGVVLGAVAVVSIGFILTLGLLGGEEEPDEASDRGQAPATDADRRGRQRTDADRGQAAERREPRAVVVRVEPTAPTYVCVDNGPGTAVVFEDTIETPQTFRNPRLVRLNLGVRSVTVTRNGEPVSFEDSAEPLGLALRRDGATDISEGERPCA